ncbi:MAG: CCA tRNA nucleotidyltransferase [Firmicutes bacterium]|mgnify:CR=1 FL=1|nr:CCA tRNA nucleotidyltransferase [Bacillota bacterium]
MENLTRQINTILSKELQALIYFLGRCSQRGSYKIYAVGGFVRDLLLGRENNDIDLVVDGSAVDFARSVLEIMPGTLRCYERFGTATLTLPRGTVFDMVTARKEFYAAPGALPTVEQSTLRNDLFRRDFTINTMACALNPLEFGKFYNFFGGLKDLREGIIRVLYKLSFIDDPLRIIRAIRFEQRFGFRIEKESFSLLKKAIENRAWEKISKERLYKEVRLVFREPKPSKVLARFAELNMFKNIFPRLTFSRELKNRLERLEQLLAEILIEKTFTNWSYSVLFLSALFYDLSEHDVRYFCYLMRLKRKERQNLLYVWENLPIVLPQLKNRMTGASNLYFLLEKMPEEGLLLAMVLDPDLLVREGIYYFCKHLLNKKPSITGKDLLKAGLEPGPIYNKILTKLHEAVLEGKISGRREEMEFVNMFLKG